MTPFCSNTYSPMVTGKNHRPRSRRVLAVVATGLALLISAGGGAKAATITVDASKQTTGNPHFWSSTFGTGKAKLALRADWQTHVKIGNRELGAQRVRGHGLFNSGEMDLYKAAGSYDWTNLDTYLSAITLANMRPLIETDFMPTALASSSSDAMHSPPKDYNAWKGFISALVQHCVDKYGAADVGTWYWEIWNEPDYPGFWTGSSDMSTYYTLYDNTVAAITSVLPNALVGGPATTQSGPVSAFLAHCKSAGTRVTFVSSHNYPGGSNTGTSADAAALVSDNNSRVSAITGNGYTTSAVKSFNTEWNSSYSGQGGNTGDAVTSMDNHWNVGFILKAAKLLSDKDSGDTPPLDVFSYWVLTDVFDEDGGTDGIHMTSVNSGNTPFGTVFGLMTYQGMRKAAFNAFKLLNYTGPKRLQSSGGTGSDGIDAMATSSDSGDSLQILVYNYYKTLNTASGSGDSVTVNVSNLPSALANQKVYVTQFLVDETHSNPYSVWSSQGKPGNPSETQWEAMHAAQHLALYPSTKVGDTQTVTTSFSTTFTLNRQAGTLIIVSAKRPLTGRNALVEIEGEDFDGQSSATKETSGDSTTLGQSISLASGGWVYFENVDYTDDGVSSVQLRVKSGADTTLELHQDTQTGTLLGSCKVSSTSNAWATQDCTLSQTVTGVSKLYVVAAGAIHLNYLKFQAGSNPPGSGGAGAGGTSGGAGGSAAGGSGGSAVGGVGGSVVGGSGGSAPGGSGGSANGGSGGSAKGGAGGSASGGGAGNAAGGAAGSANGGTGGSAAGGAGGSASGGAAGNGNGGSGGSGNAGEGGNGNTSSGNGGSSGSGGSSSTGGGGSSGCSCRIGNNGDRPSGTLLIVGLAAALFGLRRQRARRSRLGGRSSR